MFEKADLSVIIPTYNEYENILQLVEIIKDKLPDGLFTEIIIVDDNSPDGTGRLIANYIENALTKVCSGIQQAHENSSNFAINTRESIVRLVRRENKSGLISAILQGIKSSTGKYILVMDADFSHPPETVPLLINELLRDPNSIVVASRYIRGGSIRGWPYKRLLLSRLAAKIAIHGLKLCNVRDPISGFFAFPRHIIENIRFDTYGYKLLLEILVKAQGVRVKEIPYTFIDRKSGESKFDNRVMLDYLKAVWHLYRYGRESKLVTAKEEKRRSVLFLSKAARFYSVGATGLLLNYIVSMMLTKGIISNFWYLQASTIGIILSITSNFFLNKIWTFEDRNFSPRNTLKQYGMFLGLSTVGGVVQLILLYLFVQSGFQYTASLVLAVAAASVSNFLLNKKWTFREKIWG
ncbi:MAG: glycosyltransferase family 2 protein [Thermoproteota archaeon]|nr:glycosyltransferase family 2 protein [Thermoproteota archaeon]